MSFLPSRPHNGSIDRSSNLHRSRSRLVWANALGVVFVAVAVGGAAFVYGRETGASDSLASANSPALPAPDTLPGPTDLPIPGTTPDTSRPGWGVPYRNEDEAKPRFDQEFNGIKVGPTVGVPPTDSAIGVTRGIRLPPPVPLRRWP